jgi:hypothetical protein
VKPTSKILKETTLSSLLYDIAALLLNFQKKKKQNYACALPPLGNLEQLQQFGKPTWHPYNFGKTRKIGLQQFGKPTWQK